MEYVGAGSRCVTHQDDALPGVLVPLQNQGALVVTLQQACQGGILHVARRLCGRILCHRGERGSPQDIARDAVAINMLPGDACLMSNVDHLVTPLASGSRVTLTVRLECPTAATRSVRRRHM